MSRRLETILWLLCAVVVITAPPVASKEFTFDYQKIVEVDQPVTLDLRLGRGKVTVEGTSDNRLIINAVKRVRASNYDEAEEVADHIEIKVRQDGAVVDVNTNYLRMMSRGKSFWQKILGSGSDWYGDVEYTISVPSRTDLKLTCLSADINVSSVEGAIDIENESGVIGGEFIFGPITISQPNGDIDLQWIEGDVRINATSGKIAVNQVRGATDIATHTGEVYVRTELDSPRDSYVKTTSGRIHFLVPESASGELSVETAGGEIETEVPITIKSFTRSQLIGEFGQGGPKIHLSSASGNVVVAQY